MPDSSDAARDTCLQAFPTQERRTKRAPTSTPPGLHPPSALRPAKQPPPLHSIRRAAVQFALVTAERAGPSSSNSSGRPPVTVSAVCADDAAIRAFVDGCASHHRLQTAFTCTTPGHASRWPNCPSVSSARALSPSIRPVPARPSRILAPTPAQPASAAWDR